MSALSPVRDIVVDNLIALLARAKTGHGSFFDYVIVYDGLWPDPPESPAMLVIVGDEEYGERSSGLEQDAVTVKTLAVRIEARQVFMQQADLPARKVATRMIADVERIVPGHHELGGVAMNVSLVGNVNELSDEDQVEVVIGVDVEIRYQTLLTDATRES